MTGLFGPQNANAALALPAGNNKRRYSGQTYVKDASAPGAADGTVLDASFYNRIIGSLEYLCAQSGVTAAIGDTTVLYRAVLAVVARDAPAALDTLKELADALNDDAHFGTTVLNQIAARLRFDAPQALSSAQQQQARKNLGLAIVAASGGYSDLSGRPSLGTAAALNTGTGPLEVVQVGADGKLPVLDGSKLTNVVAAVAWGDVSGKPAFGTAAALNVGTAANDVVQLDGTGKLPAVDGSQLINLPGSTFSGSYTDLTDKPVLGTAAAQDTTAFATAAQGAKADSAVQPGALGTAAAKNTGTTAGTIPLLDGSGRLPAVDGSQLTNISAPGGGSIGAYVFAKNAASGAYAFGATVAGSTLRPSAQMLDTSDGPITASYPAAALTGTWRCCGSAGTGTGAGMMTVWQRIA